VLIVIAPALFVSHKVTAFEKIRNLPVIERDRAYWSVCQYLLFKQPSTEPYEYWSQQGLNVSYEDIIDVCDIADQIDADVYISRIIEWVADTLCARSRRDRYSQQQKADLVRRLEALVNSKLPNPRYIKHNGWKIASLAQIERIKKYSKEVWRRIIDQAKTIPNKSDKSLVLAMVAAAMPSKDVGQRERLFEEIAQQVEQMPDVTDKINQYKAIAYLNSTNPIFYSKYLRQAMAVASDKRFLDGIDSQRQIIDLAYRIDPDLASSLASLSNNDPARSILKQQIDALRTIHDIASQADTEVVEGNSDDFPQIAWRLLGKLNANRINGLHIERTRPYIERAASMPIRDAYPVLAWVIQNAVIRYANTGQALTLLRPIFEATILGAELTARVALRSAMDGKRLRDVRILETPTNRTIFGAGERQAALAFLRSWFEQNLGGSLKICDQFFGPEDLELLKLVHSIRPDCRIFVLSSQKHHNDLRLSNPAESYRIHWRYISDQEPPETEIVIIGRSSSKKSPIHDRWWITEGAGLSVGTSFNSLGITQESTIAPLSDEEVMQYEQELDQYLSRRRKDYNEERLEYTIAIL